MIQQVRLKRINRHYLRNKCCLSNS